MMHSNGRRENIEQTVIDLKETKDLREVSSFLGMKIIKGKIT